jgi:hypothetical protein
MENLEFIGLKDFLQLPFFNPYSECEVLDLDTENLFIDKIKIKDLLIELNDGMHQVIQEMYYVSDLMPGTVKHDNGFCYDSVYFIYIKRF